jgi:hypothetical protein
MNHSEELEPYRRRAKAALERAVERIYPPYDPVPLTFGWVPHVQDGRITFQVRLERRGRKSAVDFTVDLNRLTKPELERLNIFLGRRSAGLTTAYEAVRHLTRLLEISLRQSAPELSRAEQRRKVRELLLFAL